MSYCCRKSTRNCTEQQEVVPGAQVLAIHGRATLPGHGSGAVIVQGATPAVSLAAPRIDVVGDPHAPGAAIAADPTHGRVLARVARNIRTGRKTRAEDRRRAATGSKAARTKRS